MKSLRIPIMAIVIGIFVQEVCAVEFREFISQLYRGNKKVFIEKSTSAFIRMDLHVKKNEYSVLDSITEILFLHTLFTTTDAVNCRKGGILQIPYFWHWCEPNPRHEILFRSGMNKLSRVRPPAGYEKYKSYADIDRTPYIYIQNLLEETPLFSHPECGHFYTFGWCSEREMAFCCILSLRGYTAKIKQDGIHVWTEVMLGKRLVVKIDNTFNTFSIEKNRTERETWKHDLGSGTQVAWYNRKAHASEEIKKIAAIEVTTVVEKRIQAKITSWLADQPSLQGDHSTTDISPEAE